jgi:hypothetical protein
LKTGDGLLAFLLVSASDNDFVFASGSNLTDDLSANQARPACDESNKVHGF